MWSSDYPHTDSTWPKSRESIEHDFAGVSEADRVKMTLHQRGEALRVPGERGLIDAGAPPGVRRRTVVGLAQPGTRRRRASRPPRALHHAAARGIETDIFARVLAKHLTESWGQQVIVENRPGGGTTIATEAAAKAPPDGHVFMHAITPFGINATLYPKLSYDTLKDFACVTQIGNLYGVLLAHPSFPAKSVADLVKLAKARPGEITYATGGAGTANHITTEALRAAAGINIVHVPYKGTSQAVHDVLPGRVPLLATVLVEALPYIQTGKLRVVATTNPKRAPSLPDVPTVGETLPAYHAGNGFWAMITRAGTPAAVLQQLNADIVKALQAPDVRARLAAADVEIVGSRRSSATRSSASRSRCGGRSSRPPARGSTEGVKSRDARRESSLVGLGHYPSDEDPPGFLAIVDRFLERNLS